MVDTPDNWRQKSPVSGGNDEVIYKDPESGKYSGPFLKLLALRGLFSEEAIESFLNPSIKSLHDPYLLPGMERGVDRLIKAIKSGDKISVYGDYDADVIISSALIYNFLKRLGIEAGIYIPDRFDDGYGLNLDYIRSVTEKNKYSLIISVDCGTNNQDIQQFLRDRPEGPDIIACDHHNASCQVYPEDEKYIIINPKLPGSSYPFKFLSGGGVTFKFIIGVLRKLDEGRKAYFEKDYLSSLLDLVAISTIADVMPLNGENRILVKSGLERIGSTKNKGLRILMEITSGKNSSINEYDIGFIIAPRINAAGRMKNAMHSFDLLSEENKDFHGIANELNQFNKDRQDLQSRILTAILESYDLEKIALSQRIFIARSNEWSEGVLGIVASEIVKKFNIPAILFREKDGKLKGSGRSTPGFDLYGNLLVLENLFERFGGHRQACGISMDASSFDVFYKKLSGIAKNKISIKDLCKKYEYDMELEFACIDEDFIEELELLKPYGEENPKPVFLSTDCIVKKYRFLKSGKHLKIDLEKDETSFEALIFKIDSRKKEIIEKKQMINILYSLQLNIWQGSKSIQLIIKDIY
ncbi:MAG: single-stranded-DNA-specific exonuclease RecJ [Actinomycetota bacterium]|nr:MAG: single-stranded-DNA-specific exonuclease RecJ [Actinomycetota bacterium]